MAEPTPFSLSHLFSQLVGRDVKFAVPPSSAHPKGRQIYGHYTIVRTNGVIVVKADLSLLAAFAAALIGLPVELGIERAQEIPMNESMRDAIHEVLNIAATVVATEGRITFTSLVLLPIYCTGAVSLVIEHPEVKYSYAVSIDSKPSGLFTILSRN